MAASRLSKPGTEYGPCADACSHVDCLQTRNMARQICRYCETEIGFETRFYQLEAKSLVHANCHEEAIEKEQVQSEMHSLFYRGLATADDLGKVLGLK